jgi:hypothetical protein
LTQFIKLVLTGLLMTFLSTGLIGQKVEKKNPNLWTESWPPKNATRATWERVEAGTSSPRHKKVGRGPAENVSQAAAFYTGKFKGKTFVLRYVDTTATQNGYGSLLLSIDGKEQVFTVISPDWCLIWAGDADNDGKLDLVIESTGDGGGSSTDLFLSSKAKKGELLRFSRTLGSEDGC